jgi:hypothetical protein
VATAATKVEVTLEVERDTKNTVRFEEVLAGEFDAPKLGQLYVPKSTLGQIGFEAGKQIKVTIEIA